MDIFSDSAGQVKRLTKNNLLVFFGMMAYD